MYDELVFHLDLCILAYHLQSQTLIWPMDPYYEQMIYYAKSDPAETREQKDRRKDFMDEVRNKFRPPFTLDPVNSTAYYHGPGSCMGDDTSGWASNDRLDPIISDYRRIYPWRPSFTRPNREKEPWIVYNTPKAITDRINIVNMVRYLTVGGPNLKQLQGVVAIGIDRIHVQRPQSIQSNLLATDLLYCFEGGTGAIGEAPDQKQYAAWSMMGFVLARNVSQNELNLANPPNPVPYDVHIVFRGSRSGELRAKESVWVEKGNPDWATDMDFFEVVQDQEISQFGSVCRGFRTSIKTMLPTIIKCVEDIHAVKGRPPRTIYVTGHSLGGALACHFTSAMVMGTAYGPYGTGTKMPDALKTWPWRSTQLITFSAPIVGGEDFHNSFDHTLASRRIWLDGDPVTQEQRHYPVGAPYRIPKGKLGPLEKPILISGASHEPFLVRRFLIQDRKAKRFDIAHVPANTGEEEVDEPWKLFETCLEMLDHLQTVHGNFRECLPDFAKNLEIYFSLLKKILKDKRYQGSEMQLLINRIGNFNVQNTPVDELSAIQSDFDKIPNVKKSDSKLYDFLGVCVVLAYFSERDVHLQFVKTHPAVSATKEFLTISHKQ